MAMFITYKSILFVFFAVTASYGQTCKKAYDAKKYIGRSRITVDCMKEDLDCHHSCKSGVADIEGDSTDDLNPQADEKFLDCRKGFTTCCYVPINPSTWKVIGNSGVTIGAGLDLGIVGYFYKMAKFFATWTVSVINYFISGSVYLSSNNFAKYYSFTKTSHTSR